MGDPAFFVRWRGSGLPLRRWLMNAMAFHCRGVMRDSRREAARTFEVDGSEIAESLQSAEPGPAAAFDRAWALALTNEASRPVQTDLVSRGRGEDDAVFRMHVVEGLTYAQVSVRSGRTEAECLTPARRVSNALRAAVRDLLREEGVQESDMDAAVAEVLAIVERST
jgi:DNA-directed RNA polymerase specialized sigma24 family protein